MDITLPHLLKAIIADGCSGVQSILKISGLDELPVAFGMVSPDARKTIGL